MKRSISISINDKYWEYMKEKGVNPSKWVNERMEQEFKSKEQAIEELEQSKIKTQEKIDFLKKNMEEDKQKQEEILKGLSKEEIIELKESSGILEQNYDYFDGRYSRFKNLFDSDMDRDTFKKLLRSIKL